MEFRHAKILCSRQIKEERVRREPKSYAQVETSVGQQVVGQKSGELKLRKERPFRITARFSEAEREILVGRAEDARLTMSEYIRASVLGIGYVSAIDPAKREMLQNLSRELGRQGNNLNQVARHLNDGTSSSEEGVLALLEITRSLLSAHQSVRHALTEGRSYE